MTRPTLAAWLALLVTALATLPLLPFDETRYAGVAWEMFAGGDWRVPQLNGSPYSHKPPLLFWTVVAGWKLFGVHAAWLRGVPALCSLASLALTARLARRLWPERARIAALACAILFGSALWTVYTPALMFDLLLACCVLIALNGIVEAAAGRARLGWLLAGAGIGLGILAKGPVVLLPVLPVAVLAPWWRAQGAARLGHWFAGLGVALLLGAAIGLAWALPAAHAGGVQYARAIFWGQTAGRMIESFAHQRPLWWYLPQLPLLLFPWLLWPASWRALGRLGYRLPAERFLLAWLLPAFAAFCLISGKQVHYLLPLFPGFALLLAHALDRLAQQQPEYRSRPWLPAAGLAVLALAFLAAPRLPLAADQAWLAALPLWPAPVLAALALGLARSRLRMEQGVRRLALALPGALMVCLAGLAPAAAPRFDITPAAAQVAQAQQQGQAVAFAGVYRNEFQFLGRLRAPLDVIQDHSPVSPAAIAWAVAHPSGLLVTRNRTPRVAGAPAPRAAYPVRSRYFLFWRGADLSSPAAGVAAGEGGGR